MTTDRLDAQYQAEIGVLGAGDWHAVIRDFDDLSLYQTLPYARGRWPGAAVNHLVLRRGATVVAAAQIRLTRAPPLGGIAYVRWGPLWRRHGAGRDLEVLRQVLRAIRLEYVVRRRYVVRLFPAEFEGHDEVRQVLLEEGFVGRPSNETTVLIDLAPPLPALRAGLEPRWRTDLNRAQRGALVFTEGTDLALFDRFAPIYDEMTERKRLLDLGEVAVFRDIQAALPPEWRMRVVLCGEEGSPEGAGAITSALGDTGLAILWATNQRGRDLRAAYAIQWRVLEWLKGQACAGYDLGGVDKAVYPGGHRFKTGLAGRNGREVRFLGYFEQGAPLLRVLLGAAFSVRGSSRQLRAAAIRVLRPDRHPPTVPPRAA